jgi:hypothetical protein
MLLVKFSRLSMLSTLSMSDTLISPIGLGVSGSASAPGSDGGMGASG